MLTKKMGLVVKTYLGIPTIFLFLVGCSCEGLPENFADLSIERKIETYSNTVNSCGRGSEEARLLIAGHGGETIAAILPYLSREKTELPIGEAVLIVQDMRIAGLHFRGTAIETELRRLLSSGQLLESDRLVIRSTLALIEEEPLE